MSELGECRECVTRKKDHSEKELHKCSYCGESFCAEHMDAKHVHIPSLKATHKHARLVSAMKRDWEREGGHPCFQYSYTYSDQARAWEIKRALDRMRGPRCKKCGSETSPDAFWGYCDECNEEFDTAIRNGALLLYKGVAVHSGPPVHYWLIERHSPEKFSKQYFHFNQVQAIVEARRIAKKEGIDRIVFEYSPHLSRWFLDKYLELHSDIKEDVLRAETGKLRRLKERVTKWVVLLRKKKCRSRKRSNIKGYAIVAVIILAPLILWFTLSQTSYSLGHLYLENADFFNFYLAKFSSSMLFFSGTGWIIIWYGILPIPIPLSSHSLIIAATFFGPLILLLISYGKSGKKGLILTLIVLFSIFFAISEPERIATRDFQTIDELTTFLHRDNTDTMQYTSDFTCIDFSLTLIERAKAAGYRIYFASDGSHAFCQAYIVTEGKWVKIEPQTDEFWQ